MAWDGRAVARKPGCRRSLVSHHECGANAAAVALGVAMGGGHHDGGVAEAMALHGQVERVHDVAAGDPGALSLGQVRRLTADGLLRVWIG